MRSSCRTPVPALACHHNGMGAIPGATLIGGSMTSDLDALRAAAADDSIGGVLESVSR